MAEVSEKQNLHIHLSGNKYIVSDNYSYWIVSESKRKKKDGEMGIVQTQLTGYHGDLADLMQSYYEHTLKGAKLDGEIEDLVALIKKTKREVSSWSKKFDNAFSEVDA